MKALRDLIEETDAKMRRFVTEVADSHPESLSTALAVYRLWEKLARLFRIRNSKFTPVNYHALAERLRMDPCDVKKLLDLLLLLEVVRLVRPVDAYPGCPPVVELLDGGDENYFISAFNHLGCPTLRQLTKSYLEYRLGDGLKDYFAVYDVNERVFGRDVWRDPRLPPPEDGDEEEAEAEAHDIGTPRKPQDEDDDKDWAAV